MAARTYTASVLIAVLIATTALFVSTPTITPTSQVVSEGENIHLRCDVQDTVKAGKRENIQFKKRQTKEETPLTITKSDVLMDPTYKDRSIIAAIPNDQGHVIGYTLTIEDATAHDSGEYGCVLAQGLDTELSEIVWAEVSVRQQVQKMEMYTVAADGTKKLLKDGQAYQLTKKEKLQLMCVATGSSPEATISVWRGDQKITNQKFTKSSTEVLTPDSNHMGLITYNTTIISKEVFEVNTPQKISCKASVAEMEGQMSACIHTLFRHAPVVKCEEVVATPGKEVTLKCTITSNPKVTNVTWTVTFPNGDNRIIDGVPYFIETKHLNNNITNTNLVIGQVFENHFANDYYVKATNAEGSTRVAALLSKDPNAHEYTSTASSLAATSMLLFTITTLWMML